MPGEGVQDRPTGMDKTTSVVLLFIYFKPTSLCITPPSRFCHSGICSVITGRQLWLVCVVLWSAYPACVTYTLYAFVSLSEK